MIAPISLNKFVSFKGTGEYNDIQPKYLNALKNVNKDSFTKSQLKQQIYEEKLQSHPNVAFLYDPSLTYEEKLETLKQHPEIMSLDEIEEKYNINKKFLTADSFFELEKFTDKHNKHIVYMDLDLDINKKNFEIIDNNKGNLFGKYEFMKMYGVSANDFDDCVQSGRLQRLSLYSKVDGTLQPSSLVSLTSDFINLTLANAQKIGKTSKFFRKIANYGNKPVMANVLELSELGFGSPALLHKLVITKKLEGDSIAIDTPEGKKKYITKVNLNNKNNEKILREIRAKRCIELSDADNMFGLTKNELSNAFFDGLLKCYTDAVLVGDMEKVYIDLKSQQNIDVFNKILFEKELLNGASTSNFNRAETSQRIKVAWYLAPNTRRVASEIAQNSPEILKIIKKKARMARLIDEHPELDISDTKRNYISYEDRINLKNFYAKIWEEAGTEEYFNALEQASKILADAKVSGINNIKDDTLRTLIASTKHVAKPDFLLLP